MPALPSLKRNLQPRNCSLAEPQPQDFADLEAYLEAKSRAYRKPETEPDPAGRHARERDRAGEGAEL